MNANATDEASNRGRVVAWAAGAVLLAAAIGGTVYLRSQGEARGSDLLICVGSSMRVPMEQCVAAYEKETGAKITLSFADSGEVLAQVQHSRLGEAAVLHQPYLTQGQRDGWATATYVVATMTPVIVVAKGNPLHIKGLRDFVRPDLRIGLTDYRYATSGVIVRKALSNAGLLDAVLARKPYENKSSGQVCSQVVMDPPALDAAAVWDAVAAQQADKVTILPIERELMPAELPDSATAEVVYRNGHVPVGIIALKTAKHPADTKKFIDFVLSAKGQAIWKANGYGPEEAHATRPEDERPHRLSWEGYDGTGDRERAVYVLDGERLGQGAVGLKALRERMAAMPSGSVVNIAPYYGDPGGSVRREYPIDTHELSDFAKGYGVLLGVQSAG